MSPDEKFMTHNGFGKTYDKFIQSLTIADERNSKSSIVMRNAHRVLKTINSNKDLKQKTAVISTKALDPYRDAMDVMVNQPDHGSQL